MSLAVDISFSRGELRRLLVRLREAVTELESQVLVPGSGGDVARQWSELRRDVTLAISAEVGRLASLEADLRMVEDSDRAEAAQAAVLDRYGPVVGVVRHLVRVVPVVRESLALPVDRKSLAAGAHLEA